MTLFKVEEGGGHVPQCFIAGDATGIDRGMRSWTRYTVDISAY